MLGLTVINNWKTMEVDINNAFLNSDLVEDVFIKQPQGFINEQKPNHICKLSKALYGLKQLLKHGLINSKEA